MITGLLAFLHTNFLTQAIMNLLPLAVITPTQKIAVDVFPMREITGQGPPTGTPF